MRAARRAKAFVRGTSRARGSFPTCLSSTGPRLIEIDGHAIGHRITLAGENEPARDLVVLQREIDVHVDFALDEPAAASRAYAALARKRKLDPVARGRVDDVLAPLLEHERAARAV